MSKLKARVIYYKNLIVWLTRLPTRVPWHLLCMSALSRSLVIENKSS